MKREHAMPFGAAVLPDGRVRFRLWAPAQERLKLCLEGPGEETMLPMEAQADGWFELATDLAGPGSRYRFLLEGGTLVPDPASRFQPKDVHGPSEVVDPGAWDWQDADWRGRPWEEAVVYELHAGTFTSNGTFGGVEARLDHLRDLGITAVELMPVADFPGARNWGYDGVLPFAPDGRYGRPEALKALVQAAHARGLMVLLDVVYNHFGPEGNYLHLYAPQFFTERHKTPWGAAINFDGEGSGVVRDFFIHNALYWIEEFHFDGLRLDAVHAIADDSSPDILEELARAVHAGPGAKRPVHLVLENDHNAAHYLRREQDGYPRWYAAQWNDDIHHAAHVLATGEAAGYYADYADDPVRHLGRCLTEGFAYQGEPSPYRQGQPRGEPSGYLPSTAFVSFLQNHDQVGNRAFGERIDRLASAEAVRAISAVLLLAPSPPLLFMGQEFAALQPFPFFCDFGPDLAAAVTEGRRKEFARFPEFSDASARARIPDPSDPGTFESAVLDWKVLGRAPHCEWLALYRQLLALRRDRIVPLLAGLGPGVEGEFRGFGGRGLQVQWRLGVGASLGLLANLSPSPLPAVDPPQGALLFSTHPATAAEDPGAGRLPPWWVSWYLAERASEEGGAGLRPIPAR
jgi:maltooligosyltrehalose trehalohydrolase